MTGSTTEINPAGTTAKLRNVYLFGEALVASLRRSPHLPGLVVFHGPSGYGKTFAATYSANQFRAFYVECKSGWTKRALCLGILHELGHEPRQRVYEMTSQIAEHLLTVERPLIIDEADHVLAAGAIEVVRDIHDSSGAAIALIGEERLPAKLRAVERVHNRVLRWVAAEPCDAADAQALAALYCPDHPIAEDLLAAVIEASRGGARRICINLDLIRAAAEADMVRAAGAITPLPPALDLAWWNARPLYTGQVEPRPDAWTGRRGGR